MTMLTIHIDVVLFICLVWVFVGGGGQGGIVLQRKEVGFHCFVFCSSFFFWGGGGGGGEN